LFAGPDGKIGDRHRSFRNPFPPGEATAVSIRNTAVHARLDHEGCVPIEAVNANPEGSRALPLVAPGTDFRNDPMASDGFKRRLVRRANHRARPVEIDMGILTSHPA